MSHRFEQVLSVLNTGACSSSICSQILIHGRHARILARIFGVRSDGRRGGVEGEGGLGRKRNSV